jgi:hypothetical protein
MQSRRNWRTVRGRDIRRDDSHPEMRIGSSSNAVPVTDGWTDWMSTHPMLPVDRETGESMVSLVNQMGTLLGIVAVGVIQFGRLTISCVTRSRCLRAIGSPTMKDIV